MRNICVVTGGGSGMGLDTAKLIGKEQDMDIILVGRTVAKLEHAILELKEDGIHAESFPCDISNRESVEKLAAYAASKGNVKTVIHAAGISPSMGNGDQIFKINALGTILMDTAFAEIMSAGSCILNVASMSAYMLPEDQLPTDIYPLALKDPDKFMEAALNVLHQLPPEQQGNIGYPISKNFVVWYTAKMAVKYGSKGIRIVSISPGTFSTPLGLAEGDAAAGLAMIGALGRVGDPKEIATMMAFMTSDACSYLTGTDILYDGGTIAALNA